MNVEIRQNGRKLLPQQSRKQFNFNTLSQYSLSVGLLNGFNLIVSLTLPDGSIRLLNPSVNNLKVVTVNAKKELTFIFQTPNMEGQGSIDIFHLKKSVIYSRSNNGKLDAFEFVKIIALHLDSLKKYRLVLQSNYN